MIALVAAVIGARRGQALVVALLAVFATAGAVAGPAYQGVAERRVIDAEIAAATPQERTIQVTAVPGADWGSDNFTTQVLPKLAVPTFSVVFGAQYDGALRHDGRIAVPRFVYRDDICAHIRVLAGRCVTGSREVMVGRRTAELNALSVGSEVEAGFAESIPDGWAFGQRWSRLAVVGIYDAVDPAEPFWAGREFFGGADRDAPEPALVALNTLGLIDNDGPLYTADMLAGPDTFAPDRAAALRSELFGLATRMQGEATVLSEVAKVFDRIVAHRELVGRIMPMATIPLLALCWFVIYLAVAAATEQRQPEFGLLALRGLPRAHTSALALGPTVVPVLLGAPFGYLLGLLGVAALADAPVPLTPDHVAQAALAVIGALLAGAWGQRQLFRSAVAPMVRRVPPRLRAAGSVTVAAVAGTLAAVAVAQLRASGGQLTGVAQLGPALVALAVALGISHLVGPVSRRAGRRALRRGRLGPALASLRLARRPGAQRLLALTAVAVALLGFAAVAAGVAATARTERARAELGAVRVVPVARVTVSTLLAATRAADPEGRWAMAAVTLTEDPFGSPVLAVDSGRLVTAALWPSGSGLTAAVAANRVAPAAAEPITVDGAAVTVDATVTTLTGQGVPQLRVNLMPRDGRTVKRIMLGPLRVGRATYRSDVSGCADGCRLASLEVVSPARPGFTADLVLHRVAQGGPVRALVDGPALGGWIPTRQNYPGHELRIQPAGDGLTVHVVGATAGELDGRIRAPDAPYPVPMVAAGPQIAQFRGVDRRDEPGVIVATTSTVPLVGSRGRLADLEYLNRIARDVADVRTAQVWLGPRAPADAVDRLRAGGLLPGTTRTLDGTVAALGDQGPSVAIRFHLATGGLAVLLAAGAIAVAAAGDRADRVAELRALRVQGLRRRDSAVAGRRGLLWLVVAGVLAGAAAAALAWLAVGRFVPLFADRPPDGVLRWPAPAALLVPGAASMLVLIAVAVLASRSGRVR